MTIELLADNTEFLPTLVCWYEREWRPYYGIDGPGKAQVDLEARCNRDTVPIGFVAKENNQLLGSAALDLDAATSLVPSVVGLLVADEFRREGVASELLKSATRLAESLGYNHLYISTSMLGDHLLRNGWRWFGDAQFLNDEHGSIYVFDLQTSGR
jgi:GNAT superfamily N-acetyltransferase